MEASYPISSSISSLIEEYNAILKKNDQTRQELVALRSENPDSSKIPDLETQIQEKFGLLDQLTEKFTVALQGFLEEYVYSDITSIIEFPANLDGKWRKIAHDEADILKLNHESKGKKVRKLIISKTDQPIQPNGTDFQDSPDPILKVTYADMNGSSLKVQFVKPDENGSPIQQYHLYVSTNKNLEYKKEASSKEPLFVLKNLKPSTIYRIQITAQNKIGESDRDAEFKFMTPDRFGGSTSIFGNDSGEIIHPSIFKYDAPEQSESEVFVEDFVGLQDNIRGKIIAVNADRTALALLNDGKVLQWGLTFQDATYQEEDRDLQETVVPIVSDPFYCFCDENGLEDTIVRSIHVGPDFCIATDIEGKVYSWGLNENGQLGLSDRNPRLIPTRVTFYNERAEEIKTFITSIAIGSRNVIALDDNGRIYTWGKKQAVYGKEERDRFGQVISFENSGIDQLKPRQVTEVLNYYKVKKVTSGDSFNMVITEENHVYSWGSNPNGQLGLGLLDGKVISGSTVPRRVEFFDKDYKVLDVSCGRDHCLALVESKDLGVKSIFSWGSSKVGQCGHGDMGARVLPSQISFFKDKKIQAMEAGWRYSAVLCEREDKQTEVYVFGKICESKQMKFLLPKKFDFGKIDIERVQSIKFEKRNVFLLTE